MKGLIVFLCYLFVVSTLHSQDIEVTNIPESVTDVFSLLYSDAKNISWELIDGRYQASFKNDKKVTVAIIESDGSLFRTQTEIKACALPQEAVDFLEKEFIDNKIDYAAIIEDAQGIISFEAEVDKVDFRFDSNGKVLPMPTLVSGSGN